ncbi:tetratricopeptide repeat-containing hybrid sensor histidine kinase/response regulator [Flavobacterium restrictum]|uniref:histidine kinase n=1 Tax=Flavobacterium restrictum TaxID=2594428 RepID=A0A553E2J0_9FLAO|nr:ATP-binding protein [Flavobacterium restrictum]TRX39200.1 response regulator [Flavobacterium restrictum]
MKYIVIVILFWNAILLAQPKATNDSVAYYSSLARYNFKINNTSKGIYFIQKSILFSQKKHLTTTEINQNYWLGKVLLDQKKYNEALLYFQKTIELFNTTKPTVTLANTYYLMGLASVEKGDFEASKTNFDRAESVRISLKMTDSTDGLNLKKGILFQTNKNFELATETFQKIVKKPDTHSNLKTKTAAYYRLGLIENERKQNDSAISYLEKALILNSKNNDLEQKAAIMLAFSKSYKELQQYDRAYSYLEEYHQIKLHSAEIKSAKSNRNSFAKFKQEEVLKIKIQKEKDAKQIQKAAKYSKLTSILAIALITILPLLSLSLYKNNIIRSDSNQLLKDKNNELIIAKNNAEKASKARSEFLSTVSHELRTPLNAINGITHLLLEDNPKKSQLDYLKSLQFSGNYLATFINDILEINKIESSKIEVENIAFNLKQLLFDIHNSQKEFAIVNNNDFKLEIAPDIPDYLIGDPTKLSQIFLNLINNALKFTKNGAVIVTAQVSKVIPLKANIYFEIIDTGIGIPEEQIENVFENFSQGSVEINRKYGGTGLGLTIVKNLVKILGGKINLNSEINKGSTFSFELPFSIPTKLEAVEKKTAVYDANVLENKKILLVEDNRINQMITKKMLENKGVNCEIIDNGEDAIVLIQNNTYDLVLMDVHLPGINGTIATQQIRDFDNNTPIIALTAISLHENREMLLSYGMNDVITKPFVPEEFYKKIAEYI